MGGNAHACFWVVPSTRHTGSSIVCHCIPPASKRPEQQSAYIHGVLSAPPVSKAGNGIGEHLPWHTVFAGLPRAGASVGVHRPVAILQHWGRQDLPLDLQGTTNKYLSISSLTS